MKRVVTVYKIVPEHVVHTDNMMDFGYYRRTMFTPPSGKHTDLIETQGEVTSFSPVQVFRNSRGEEHYFAVHPETFDMVAKAVHSELSTKLEDMTRAHGQQTAEAEKWSREAAYQKQLRIDRYAKVQAFRDMPLRRRLWLAVRARIE